MNRKLRKNYYFSVEGETEKWYLKWLENQINNNDNALLYSVFLHQKTPLTRDVQDCIKKNTIILKTITTPPIMINIMDAKLFVIGLST